MVCLPGARQFAGPRRSIRPTASQRGIGHECSPHQRSYSVNMSSDFDSVTPALKLCPFCGDCAAVIQGDDGRFAVQCRGCKASTARIYSTPNGALLWWQARFGCPSFLGGAATKGLTTAKKAEASRKNLQLARRAKKLNRERTTPLPPA